MLVQAPTLALPNPDKPFTLYNDRDGFALEALTQTYGPDHKVVAYFFKSLDPSFLGWPACLHALASTALLLQEALKFVPYVHLTVISPHNLTSLLTHQAITNASPSRIQSVHAQLLLNLQVQIQHTPDILNLATFLAVFINYPSPHNCLDLIDQFLHPSPTSKIPLYPLLLPIGS